MNLTIRALDPGLLPAYLKFFDDVAFVDHPEWQMCYCNFLYHDHDASPWKDTVAADNRAAVEKRICSRAMHGYLAFDGENPIGWCHAARRTSIASLASEPDPDNTADVTGSIACFVIAAPYRRKGLAQRLLAAACDGFRDQGLTYAEAYPREDAVGDGANHFGPLSMYLKAGFEPLRTDADGTVTVRKPLTIGHHEAP